MLFAGFSVFSVFKLILSAVVHMQCIECNHSSVLVVVTAGVVNGVRVVHDHSNTACRCVRTYSNLCPAGLIAHNRCHQTINICLKRWWVAGKAGGARPAGGIRSTAC